MKEVDFTHRAYTDLREIWQFTAGRWTIDQADTYLSQILETCNSIASELVPGRSAAEVRPGYRKRSIGSHVIYYQESPDAIVVVRILHQRMDASRNFDE